MDVSYVGETLFPSLQFSLNRSKIIIFTRVATNENEDGDTNIDSKEIQIQIQTQIQMLEFSLNRDQIIIFTRGRATNRDKVYYVYKSSNK